MKRRGEDFIGPFVMAYQSLFDNVFHKITKDAVYTLCMPACMIKSNWWCAYFVIKIPLFKEDKMASFLDISGSKGLLPASSQITSLH